MKNLTVIDLVAEMKRQEANSNILKEIELIRVSANNGDISGDEFLNQFFNLKAKLTK